MTMTDDKRPDLRLIDGDAGKDKKQTPKPKRRRRLTAKQEKFLDGMVKGMTQADAFRASRDCSKWKPSAIYTESNRLMQQPEIHRRLMASRAAVTRAALSTGTSKRLWIVERLERLAEDGEVEATKLRALELLGKCSDVGLFLERTSVETPQSSEEVRAELEQRLTALLDR